MSDTLAKLVASLKSSHEEYPIHEAVVKYAAVRVGKPITKKDCAALEALCPGWTFSVHSAGASWAPAKEIVFWQNGKWNETRSEVRVASGHGLLRWSAPEAIVADTQNARYFKHAAERNAARAEALNPDTGKPAGLAKAAVLVDQLALLHAELKATIEAYGLAESDARWEICKILKDKTGGEEFKELW